MVIPWPPSREDLERAYVSERLDLVQIGAAVGKDPKTVWHWMRKLGVPTRGRGTNTAVHFRKGAPSAFKGMRHTDANRELVRQLRLADGHVPYLKNGVHYSKGKSGPEVPSWRGGSTPERQAFYCSPEWKRACSAAWTRADAKCERCALDHRTLTRDNRGSFHVHHVVSFAVRELRADPSNLVLLCSGCHRWVHSRKNTRKEFLAQ